MRAGTISTTEDAPVALFLDATRVPAATLAAGGVDLRFVSDTGSLLPHEVELTGGADLIAWVRVRALGPATKFWLYTGNATASDAANPDLVWPDYLAVHHLAEPPGSATVFTDSTPNGFDATNSSTSTGREGRLGRGQECAVAGDNLNLGNRNEWNLSSTGITLEAWVRRESTGFNFLFVFHRAVGGVPGEGYQLLMPAGTMAHRVRWSWRAESGNPLYINTDADSVDTQWHHYVAVADPASNLGLLYIDGQLSRTDSYADLNDRDADLRLCGDGNQYPLAGFLDEARISSGARSAGYINVQFLSQTDQLFDWGLTETLPEP